MVSDREVYYHPFCLTCILTLLCELRRNGKGCYLGWHYVGCIAYADDFIFLSASLCNLQSMLDVCHNVGSSLDIAFNSSKSYLFKVGPGFAEYLSRLNIGCDDIQWTDRLKYLSIRPLLYVVVKCEIDISVSLRKAYSAANSILSKTKYVSEIVRLNLIESYVFPIFYALEAVTLSLSQQRQFAICLNNLYRRYA